MRIINFGIVTIFLLLFVTFASADDGVGGTEITGVIYEGTTYLPVANALVTVNCDGNEKQTTSDSIGQYSVIYDKTACHIESLLTVSAEKDGLSGYNTGTINTDPVDNNWNLAIVHVAVVPEFGFFMGILTLMSGVGIFFIIRK